MGGGGLGLGLVGLTTVAVVELDDVTVTYERHPAVHHLSGRFADGSLTAVVGPNGAGKSTLLKAIVGLMRPSSGRVRLTGVDRRGIGYLPQMSAIDEAFPIAVRDVVAMGMWRRIGAFRPVTRAMLDDVGRAIAAVGLAGFETRPFSSLSMGQRQRALFARVMASDARLIVLDEPFSAMDERTMEDLTALIEHWHAEGRTQMVVLHDFDRVRGHFPDALLMARGKVAWGPTDQVLVPEHLGAARAMSESWVTDAIACRGAA